MAYHGYKKGPYNNVPTYSSYTPSSPSSSSQPPYQPLMYSQQQSLSPAYLQESYYTTGTPPQQSSSFPYANEPSSYPKPMSSYKTMNSDSHSLSSVPMRQTVSTSSSGSSGSGYSRNDYPGSSNPTSPSDAGYEIDFHYTIAPSSKSKAIRKPLSQPSQPSPPKSDKPFICLEPRCEFRTAREFDLKRHMKNHFEPAPEDMFPCPGKNCVRVGKHAFKRKDHMMEHVANFHDGYINGKKVVVTKKRGGSRE